MIISDIPHDLLLDILCRLPVKSLVRFKTVHSEWFSLISNPQFCRQHLQFHAKQTGQKYGAIELRDRHTLHPSLFLRIIDIVDNHHHDYELVEIQNVYDKLVFKRYDYPKLLGCCNGLLLISLSTCLENFILWNPTIREYRRIHRENHDRPLFNVMYMAGIGYDSLNNNYKIVVAESYKFHKDSIEVHIYDLKKSSWEARNYYFPYKFVLGNTPVITLPNGILHWHVKTKDEGRNVILSFDLAEEIFNEVPLPENIYDFSYLSSLDGCLSIGIRRRFAPIYVWKMREYGIKKSWIKLTISFPIKYRCLGYLMPFEILENYKVVMNVDTKDIAIFDVITHFYEFVPESRRIHNFTVAAFNQTLVSPYQ
ncbi:F-box protein CPR1-like [Mercurialis annua]|uniref:F-box protein CPR1-like n=1 Tax=Mercurialis annua TaxID=3986 RepID=UPI00215F9DD0|nr:F-box protein CPR1-like [Mercurialis annua]